MLEKRVKERVKKACDEAGAWYCMPATGGFGRSGVPDFLICRDGKFLAVECKGTHGRLSMSQRVELGMIAECGGEVFCATPDTTVEEMVAWLKK